MTAPQLPIVKRAICEGLGTALLVAAVVGSGIMAERLAGGNNAIALLANTIATGTALAALILTFGPLSGAHFNPLVTLAGALRRVFSWGDVTPYIVAQVSGGLLGTVLAHVMFGLPGYSWSLNPRSGWAQAFSEFVATFGLLIVIWSCTKSHSLAVTAMSVASYITAAYWFTASTSFANPAVTIARSLTNTFAGIRPVDVPAFLLAQFFGAVAATLLAVWLDRSGQALPGGGGGTS